MSGAAAAPSALQASALAALRRHAAGVCVLTGGAGEEVNGMVVTAATSFSMEPPSVLVCVNRSASVSALVEGSGAFGLTLLAREHEAVASAFSRKPSGRPRFATGDWRFEPDRTPWLADAPANLWCRVERSLAYATHTAFVGRIEAVRLGPDRPSLVYRDGVYATAVAAA